MKVWLLGSIGILLLCGCAEVKYVKAGATESDFATDKVDCHNQILMSPSGADLAQAQMASPGRGMATTSTSATARQDVDQCLRTKGWVKETEAK
ncbi:MAG: hypothetical protein ACERKU_05275 [Nitrospirota bacterium]